jgi:hypothetical protein
VNKKIFIDVDSKAPEERTKGVGIRKTMAPVKASGRQRIEEMNNSPSCSFTVISIKPGINRCQSKAGNAQLALQNFSYPRTFNALEV